MQRKLMTQKGGILSRKVDEMVNLRFTQYILMHYIKRESFSSCKKIK